MTWDAISSGFFLGIVKFLFAASFLEGFYPSLSVFQVFIITASGALFAFNLTFWLSEYFLIRSKRKRLAASQKSGKKKKRVFSRTNKTIVKIKMSRFGFYIMTTIGLLLMSIPLGGIIVAKFYGGQWKAYLISTFTILITAFILAYFNEQIFTFVKSIL